MDVGRAALSGTTKIPNTASSLSSAATIETSPTLLEKETMSSHFPYDNFINMAHRSFDPGPFTVIQDIWDQQMGKSAVLDNVENILTGSAAVAAAEGQRWRKSMFDASTLSMASTYLEDIMDAASTAVNASNIAKWSVMDEAAVGWRKNLDHLAQSPIYNPHDELVKLAESNLLTWNVLDYTPEMDWSEVIATTKIPSFLDNLDLTPSRMDRDWSFYFPKYELPIINTTDLFNHSNMVAAFMGNLDILSDFQQIIPDDLLESVEKSLSFYGASDIKAAVSFAEAIPGVRDAIDELVEEHSEEVEEFVSSVTASTIVMWGDLLKDEKIGFVKETTQVLSVSTIGFLGASTIPLAGAAIVVAILIYVLHIAQMDAAVKQRKAAMIEPPSN